MQTHNICYNGALNSCLHLAYIEISVIKAKHIIFNWLLNYNSNGQTLARVQDIRPQL